MECDRRERALTRIEADAEFQARLRAGDEAAFTELHNAYRPHLIAYLSHWTDRDTAEDIAQIAFIAVWKVLPRFRFEAPLWFFIKRAAKLNVLHQWRYANYRKGTISLDDDNEGTAVFCSHLADPTVGDFDEMVQRAQALGCLTPEQRQVIELLYGQEITRGSAAAQMQCSVGTIEARHENALRQLRGYFTGEAAALLPEQGAAIRKRNARRAQYATLDLTHLKPRTRIAFELVYGEGLSYAEAAQRMNLKASTVKSRCQHALQRLAVATEPTRN
jgi:RNA polymerase sigma-70 factor, ECF subfamily